MNYEDFRRKPLEKGRMSIKKLRKEIKKAYGICETGNVLRKFLCQFSKLEIRWIYTEIVHNLDEKYNIGCIIMKKEEEIDEMH